MNQGRVGDDALAMMNCYDRPAMSESPRWYALTVKHQHEQAIEGMLRYKDFETLAPVYRISKQWSDRNKQLEKPLFAGYVFCRFSVADKVEVSNTPGVGRIVGFGGYPVPIPDEEVVAIQLATQSGLPFRPWPRLQPGGRVRVERGPLRGMEGVFVREKDAWTFVIGVELLQRWVAVEMDPEFVTPLETRATYA
jgi:transcription termination/antitermination protein NusG